MKKTSALVLLAHGSRAPETLEEMEKLVHKLSRRRKDLRIAPAFLSMAKPDLLATLQNLAETGVSVVQILPLFLFTGKHLLEDIPALIAEAKQKYPNLKITAHKAIGHHTQFLDFLLEAAGL